MVLDVEQALPEWARRRWMIGELNSLSWLAIGFSGKETLHPHKSQGRVHGLVRSIFTEPARLSVEAITKTLVEETAVSYCYSLFTYNIVLPLKSFSLQQTADRNITERMQTRLETMRRQVDVRKFYIFCDTLLYFYSL